MRIFIEDLNLELCEGDDISIFYRDSKTSIDLSSIRITKCIPNCFNIHNDRCKVRHFVGSSNKEHGLWCLHQEISKIIIKNREIKINKIMEI